MNAANKERFRNTWLHPRYISRLYLMRGVEEMSRRVSGTVLDVGCGRRTYEPIIRRRATGYWGIDRPAFPEAAAPDVVADAMEIPFRSASIDTVIATEVMEHLPSSDRFLTEVNRVLRRGGHLILSTPFFETLHEEPRDYFRFTLHGLRALLADHGFVEVSNSKRGGWWSVVLGNLACHALYETASPHQSDGTRRRVMLGALVLPVCAVIQFVAYLLDRVMPGKTCAMGYIVLARKEDATGGQRP